MTNKAFESWKVSDVRRIKGKFGYKVTLIYPDGTTKVQQKSGFTSERECKKARDTCYAQLFSGTYVVNEKLILKDFLKEWMDTVIIKKKANTYDSYSYNLKNHIYPKLGNMKLTDINKGHLIAFYASVCEVSSASANLSRVILKTALRYAVSKKFISENPAENVLLPKEAKKDKEYRTIRIKKEQTLSVEQLKLLIEKSKETKIYLYILFGAIMGLRKSEIRGLKYSDIDYARQTIHVNRQLGKDLSKDQSKLKPKTKTKQEIDLKTNSSDRELDIPDIVFNAIVAERKRYEANRRRRTNAFQDLDYICCSSYGRPRSATYASKQYKALLRDNGLPDIRFHDLRHTYASMLLSEELSVKAVSNTLGHAKSIVTVDVYGDKARIIGDGTDAMRPMMEYILPAEFITSREAGFLVVPFVYDNSIGFPEELANDIVDCLLHKSTK